jgi:hypothetical protein
MLHICDGANQIGTGAPALGVNMSSIIPRLRSAAAAPSNQRVVRPDCVRSSQKLSQNGHNDAIGGSPKSAPYTTAAPVDRLQHDDAAGRSLRNL